MKKIISVICYGIVLSFILVQAMKGNFIYALIFIVFYALDTLYLVYKKNNQPKECIVKNCCDNMDKDEKVKFNYSNKKSNIIVTDKQICGNDRNGQSFNFPIINVTKIEKYNGFSIIYTSNKQIFINSIENNEDIFDNVIKDFNITIINRKRQYRNKKDSIFAITLLLFFIIAICIDINIGDIPWVSIVYIVSIFMGVITEYIAKEKGRKGGFAWGFFLNIIGLIVVGVLPNENTQKVESVNSVTENADAIKKYKELLDMGAITEEEFEIKKKELLK